MASAGEPMPPTGGRCGVGACAKPAAAMAINPPKMTTRTDNAGMLFRKTLGAIFLSGFILRKTVRLNSDIVDQPGGAELRGHQHPHRPVLDRDDRRQRFGVADLEIVQLE